MEISGTMSMLIAILGVWLLAVEIHEAPEGYEDATGFNYGRVAQ